jgi:hypothetical protein
MRRHCPNVKRDLLISAASFSRSPYGKYYEKKGKSTHGPLEYVSYHIAGAMGAFGSSEVHDGELAVTNKTIVFGNFFL